MLVDETLLNAFEKGLNPQRLEDSPVKAEIIGYGEISAIFRIQGHPRTAYKRLPLFSDYASAEKYTGLFNEYCRLLSEAGLCLPLQETFIIEIPGRPTVLYIAQEMLPAESFGHRLLQRLEVKEIKELLEGIAQETSKVWILNRSLAPDIQIALDGQISNWVCSGDKKGSNLMYIDTGTPLFRKKGVEQLEAELFLKSAPAFLRWILRLFFLKDVFDRYYDLRRVFLDLAANLYKEQRPDLIPITMEVINHHLPEDQVPLKAEEVKNYYRTDRLIWTLFLAFRRFDRWMTTRLFQKRYEFILPGKIKR
ncbi:MAG: DUF6206 family protein [Thermodesulfobacteriota bacterium]